MSKLIVFIKKFWKYIVAILSGMFVAFITNAISKSAKVVPFTSLQKALIKSMKRRQDEAYAEYLERIQAASQAPTSNIEDAFNEHFGD